MEETKCTAPPCQVRIFVKVLSRAVLLVLCYFYSPNAWAKQTIKSTVSHLETIWHRSHIHYAVFTIRKKMAGFKSFSGLSGLWVKETIKKFQFFQMPTIGKKKFFEIAKKSIHSFNHFFCSMWEISTAKPGHNMTTTLYNINSYLGFTSQMPNFQHKMDCIPLNYLL